MISDRVDDGLLAKFTTHFPEKILATTLETPEVEVELWNVRAVPWSRWGEEKVKILETVYDWVADAGQRLRILAGDFNSPAKELADGQAIPFGYDKTPVVRRRQVNAELNILKELGHLGTIDVFRAQHGYGDLEVADTSWRGKRFDHLLASAALNPEACHYDHNGPEVSDHAPIIAEFAP